MGDQLELFGASGTKTSTLACPCCMFLSESIFLPSDRTLPSHGDSYCGESSTAVGEDKHICPRQALEQIVRLDSIVEDHRNKTLLVDTHGHAHLEREPMDVYSYSPDAMKDISLVSLTCAVEESDWEMALEYASQSDSILPGLGIHPWYLADLSPDWLPNLESLLLKHPSAIVGEIGLCKMARFVRSHPDGKSAALAIQRQVFVDQMKLAARLERPVSVHCVKQHGVFMSVLNKLVESGEVLPPAVGMHSFTGTAHHVKEILKWEVSHCSDRTSPLFYFGFSHSINYAMCSSEKSRRQGREAIRAVPVDRLMAESDVHNTENVAAGTAGAVASIASALDQPLEVVARLTASNGLSFLSTAIRKLT